MIRMCRGYSSHSEWARFSATCMYFGAELIDAKQKLLGQAEADVPIGLIQSAVGGTQIERWVRLPLSLSLSLLLCSSVYVSTRLLLSLSLSLPLSLSLSLSPPLGPCRPSASRELDLASPLLVLTDTCNRSGHLSTNHTAGSPTKPVLIARS